MLGGAIGGAANVGASWALGNEIDPLSSDFWVDTGLAFGVGAITQGRGVIGTVGVSVYGATVGSYLKAEDPLPAQVGSFAGSVVGYYLGNGAIRYITPYAGNAASQIYGQFLGGVAGEVIGAEVEDMVRGVQ